MFAVHVSRVTADSQHVSAPLWTHLRIFVLLLGGVHGGVCADDRTRVLHHAALLVHQQLALHARLYVLRGDYLHSAARDPLV